MGIHEGGRGDWGSSPFAGGYPVPVHRRLALGGPFAYHPPESSLHHHLSSRNSRRNHQLYQVFSGTLAGRSVHWSSPGLCSSQGLPATGQGEHCSDSGRSTSHLSPYKRTTNPKTSGSHGCGYVIPYTQLRIRPVQLWFLLNFDVMKHAQDKALLVPRKPLRSL